MNHDLVAFDLYRTLLDISSLAQRMAATAPMLPDAAALLAAWRKAQIKRTWLSVLPAG